MYGFKPLSLWKVSANDKGIKSNRFQGMLKYNSFHSQGSQLYDWPKSVWAIVFFIIIIQEFCMNLIFFKPQIIYAMFTLSSANPYILHYYFLQYTVVVF